MLENVRSLPLVARGIAARLGTALGDRPVARVRGGSIDESYRWQSEAGPLFVKIASAGRLALLEAEAAGLEALRGAGAVRVPRVLASGTAEDVAYLALEWIELHSPSAVAGRGGSAETRLGEALARQHRVSAEHFGWSRDNSIGRTPQPNGWMSDWAEFFRERRLRYQLELARAQGYAGILQGRGAELLGRVDALLASHRPVPSLLHGDLWGGNWGVAPDGAPVIFDPAVYYGDREADLAMTQLFGGFGPRFYAAYQAAWPLEEGAGARATLYNLYHVLNHLNLFGGGYLGQAEAMIERLLAALPR